MKDIIDTSNCYVLGDIHGEWKHLNTFINKKQPTTILQVGDLGFWPAFHNKTTLGDRVMTSSGIIKKKWYQDGMKMGSTNLYWCDGNHEDHWALREIVDKNPDDIMYEVCPKIFYLKRGSIVGTTDGRNILFMGGATSIDKNSRTLGFDWFPGEVITQNDIYNLEDKKVDIVISHTCPREFLPEVLKSDLRKYNDSCYDALSYILQKYNPKLWYFGHFHHNISGFYNNTSWFCLNMAKHSGWFEKLLK